MVVRFINRLFSFFFFALALVCWLLASVGVYQQFVSECVNFSAFAMSILSSAMAVWCHTLSIDAWRAARNDRHDPFWRDFP